MTVYLGGNPLSSTLNVHEDHRIWVAHVANKPLADDKCAIGGMPIACFDLGEGSYALGISLLSTGLTNENETLNNQGFRYEILTHTSGNRVLSTVRDNAGGSTAVYSTAWKGVRLGLNASNSLLVQNGAGSIAESAFAMIGGVPIRCVRISDFWYICIQTASTIT